MSIPNNYIEGIPRVSQIVEWKYPFEGESEARFHKWLKGHGISVEEYMREASSGGTAIHLAMEMLGQEAITGEEHTINARYAPFVASGKAFMHDYKIKTVASELYICTDDYQGTIDRVAEIGKRTFVLDWKSYGLAKHYFSLPIPEYKKPYDKLKKATLQLSLYAHALGIKNIAVVELLIDGYKFHILERMSKREINTIIRKFKKHV